MSFPATRLKLPMEAIATILNRFSAYTVDSVVNGSWRKKRLEPTK